MRNHHITSKYTCSKCGTVSTDDTVLRTGFNKINCPCCESTLMDWRGRIYGNVQTYGTYTGRFTCQQETAE